MDSHYGTEVSCADSIQTQRSQRLYQRFVTDAAAGLSFSHDILVDLSGGSVSYGQADFSQLFRLTGALKPSTKRKTQQRKLCGRTWRPEGRQAPSELFRDSLPLLKSFECVNRLPAQLQTDELLQDSCNRTTETAVRPVNNVATQRWTGRDNNKILRKDMSDLADQVQKAVITSCTSAGLRPESDSSCSEAVSWMTAQCLALDEDHSRTVIERLLAQLFLCEDHQPDAQDQLQSSQDQPHSSQDQPHSSQDQPHSSQDQPHSSQDQPHSSQDQPHSSQGQPHSSQDQPHSSQDQPHSSQDQPNSSQDQPHSSQDQPHSSQDQPHSNQDSQLVVSLLTYISSQTTLVRSLLAEKLNSSDWRDRLLACNTLSSLKGPINKDVVQKLTHLMFSDHSCAVCLAAAEALMKLGKVQDLHRVLRLKLEEGQCHQDRMQALYIISHLKFMTGMLLKPLVSCFSAECIAVRQRACVTAATMLLKDEMVVSRLLELVENDPAWAVRLSAVRAVGALGLSSPDVQETLLHCLDSDEEPKLRLAACQLLQSAGVPSAWLRGFLLHRTEVESSPLVQRTMKEVLDLCSACSLQEDPCEVEYVRLQVKRQCEWTAIAEKVLLLEKLQSEQCPGQNIHPRMMAKLLCESQHLWITTKASDQY